MKTIINYLIALISLTSLALAQDFELKSINTSLGKSSLSSGYDITLIFSDNDNTLQITGNHQRCYAAYSWSLPYLTVSASGGFYKNSPWLGPKIIFQPSKYFSIMSWYALNGGEPDKPDWKINSMFRYNAISLYPGYGITLGFAICGFMFDKTNYYPGASYKFSINSKWNMSVAIDYDYNGKEPLFQLGTKFNF